VPPGPAGLPGDAIHNLSDVSTSAVVFAGSRPSRRPATERYPYGLERAEDLARTGIAAVIWASAAIAGYVGVPEARLAGRTGLAGAIGADLGAVALVIGGYVQGGQDGLDLAGLNQDCVLAGRLGRRRLRPGRYLADVGAERVGREPW